ncbi:MAG: adenylate/guanylate cyclase domain-containing protein [Candidatus Rifleibacteriota bacterium]
MPSKRRPQLILTGSMNVSHIEERINQLAKTYALYFISGILAVIFFLKLLQARLIHPISNLVYYLEEIKAGHFNKVATTQRNDEFKNIFEAYNQMIDGLKVRQRLLSITSDSAVEELRQKQTANNSKKTKSNQVVCLVSDIRSFTTLCESYNPETITRLLNLHFDRMSQIIHAHNGEIIRFVGDAIEARFPCPTHKREKVFEEVVEASLQMLATLSLINQERKRQKLFTYNIGIGISYGSTSSFTAGEKFGRAELLQVGKPLERAIKLEELSKNYQDFPLLIDAEIGNALKNNAEKKFKIYSESRESYEFFVFKEPPESSSYFSSFATNGNETDASSPGKKSNKKENGLTAFIHEKFNHPILVFLLGCMILFLPAFHAIQNIYKVYFNHSKTLKNQAHKQNRFILETRKLPQARKELLEIELRKKITTLANETANNFSKQDFPNLKKQLSNKIESFGLKSHKIVFNKYDKALTQESVPVNFPGDKMSFNLECVLNECLRLNDCQLNVFLEPDTKVMKFLGKTVNRSGLLKEARTRFINVNLASEAYWLYWQPIYNTQRNLKKSSSSKRFKAYGSFSSAERDLHLLGGVIILCHPPESSLAAGNSSEATQSVYARIDLRKQLIVEKNGDLKNLIEEHKNLYPEFSKNNISNAEMLTALSQQKFTNKSDWAFDFEIIQQDAPQLNLAATRIPDVSFNNKALTCLGITFFVLYSLSVLFLWYKSFYREKYIAKTLSRQILGSFTGLLIFPVIGIFITLTVLINGWQESLLQQTRQSFLERTQKMEEKLQLHRYLVPQKLEKFMNNNGVGKFFKGSQQEKNKLGNFLELTFKKMNTKARALGVNSIMINTYSGRREFLLMDGTLASDSNPMKQTFGYHADQLIERLNDKDLEKLEQKNSREKLSEEIAAELVLNVLASSYGNDIVLDLLFGFRKPVKFFSGYSSQVAYQYLYPDAQNPLGLISFSLSYYHSNIFSMSRIMAAQYFREQENSLIPMQIFTVNNPLPGLPTFPEDGENFPFIKELGQKSGLVGEISRWTEYQNKRYYLTTYRSNLAPQFTFTGFIKESDFTQLINRRALNFAAILAIFILMLLALATQTARDFIRPLHSLLLGMKNIGRGNYQTRIFFTRDDEFATLANSFNNMAQNLSEKNKLAKMVSESAFEMASSDEAELQARKGQRRLVAVLYLGIQNYQELIQTNEPSEIQTILNAWIDRVSETVSSCGGEIDKVMEGKILATFFADKNIYGKTEKGNYEFLLKAFNAATQICHSRQKHPITVGGGIYKGIVISGLMGNKERRDMTVIGDTVNIAARCFSIAVQQSNEASIITTESTAEEIRSRYSLETIGNYSIKGKKKKIQLFKITSSA